MYYWTKDEAFLDFMEYTHWRADAKLVRRWFNMSAEHHRLADGHGHPVPGRVQILQKLP